jgi:SAM-dependent methyltransferase
MSSVVRDVGRGLVHAVTRGRQRERRWLAGHAERIHDARILEIGSGKPVDGAYPYSFATVFDETCTVTMTDIDPTYGHAVVDVMAMDFDQDFDVVVCANVLEHLPEPQRAADGIRRALAPGGIALVTVPMMYPLHDEPGDYWRITEHGLRYLFRDFATVEVTHGGARLAPFGYLVRAARD